VLNGSDRHFVVALALALLLAGLVVILRPTTSRYLELLKRAEGHVEAFERTAAVAAYEEAARVHPRAPLPHLSLARLYLNWGRTDEALDAVAEAERRGAESVEVERLRIAIDVARAGTSITAKPAHWEGAVEHAQELLAFDPDSEETLYILARAYLGLREWEAARSIYNDLLRLNSEDARAHERLGALLLGEDTNGVKHLQLAESELSRQLLATFAEAGSAGDLAYMSTRVGHVLIENQEWPLAARQFQRAVSHRPDYADAHMYLGHALDHMGYPEDARSHLLKATQTAPHSPVAHTLLGLHYDRFGDGSAARAEYEAAYDLAPANPALCVEIGQTWAAEGRYVAAEVWLREAISLKPGDPGLWEILARFYLDHNITSDDQAVRATRKLLELVPESATAHDLRGWAAFQIGDYETARQHLQRAIELDAEMVSAHYHLGRLENAQGHSEEAEEAFTRAVNLDTTGRFLALVHRARKAGEGDR
jgi:tetratricopeptide (TPR) repeat protein